jgi:hypothetical protein
VGRFLMMRVMPGMLDCLNLSQTADRKDTDDK